jgi:hypothetical protein
MTCLARIRTSPASHRQYERQQTTEGDVRFLIQIKETAPDSPKLMVIQLKRHHEQSEEKPYS